MSRMIRAAATAVALAAGAAAAPAAADAPRWFPEPVPAARSVAVVDVANESFGVKLAATTLQGLANRDGEADVYLLLADWDQFWLDDLLQRGLIDEVRPLALEEYIEAYGHLYAGVVVPDEAVGATFNVATMMGSVDDRIVVMEEDLALFAEGKEVERLAGRWASNTEAYDWAFRNLRPRMRHSVLASWDPTHIPSHLRDYLVQQRIFAFWITGRDREDGVVSDFERERAFAEMLFAATPANSPVIGFWSSGGDHSITEYHGVLLAGQHGLVTVPCDWGTNISFLSGVGVDLDAAAAVWRGRVDAARVPALDPDAVYIAFDVIDSGDAAHYWQALQYSIFLDPARGTIPINWSLGVATAELYPSVLAWHYENASELDTFFCGMSGLGYSFPYLGYAIHRHDRDRVRRGFLEATNAWMERLRLRDLVLYTDSWAAFDREANLPTTLDFARLPAVRSLILGFGRDGDQVEEPGTYLLDDGRVVVSHTATRWDPDNVGRNEANNRWLVEEIRAHTPPGRPAFLHVQAMSWNYYPSDIAEVIEALGPEYVPVTLGQFNALFRQHEAGGGG